MQSNNKKLYMKKEFSVKMICLFWFLWVILEGETWPCPLHNAEARNSFNKIEIVIYPRTALVTRWVRRTKPGERKNILFDWRLLKFGFFLILLDEINPEMFFKFKSYFFLTFMTLLGLNYHYILRKHKTKIW